jgi:hypothetical protein
MRTGRRLERFAGLEEEHCTRKRAPQLTHGHGTASMRRIHDLHTAPTHALEYHEVTEIPVENAPWREILEIFDLDGDAATAQPVVTGGVQQRKGRRAVALATERRTKLVDANDLPVKRQDHRQARRTAF